MKSLEEAIRLACRTRNRIIYSGICSKCGEVFYTYATNYPGFCSRFCGHFKGGCVTQAGYRVIRINNKLKLEHRMVVEAHIGRSLSKDEEVHHLDHNKLNNDLNNLQILSKSDHAKLHHILRH